MRIDANYKVSLSPPNVGPEEVEALSRAVESGSVGPRGAELDLFEGEVAAITGREYAVGVSSGTAALHLSLLALGVGPGQVVICPTMTFVATANAIAYTGARPVFVDVERDTGNICPVLLESVIRDIQGQDENLVGVVAVDFLGKCANYSAIAETCQRYSLFLLADSAESLGSNHKGKPAGSFGDVAIFSFNTNKIVTSSGGGMIVTDNEQIADHVRTLSSQARLPVWHYQHEELGFNYRLSNLLGAFGRAQLAKLPQFLQRKKEIKESYRSIFDKIVGVSLFADDAWSEDNNWLTAVVVDQTIAGFSSLELAEHLRESGIETRPLWKPMHLQPLYSESEVYLDGRSEELYREGLVLPSGSGMSEDQLSWIRQVAHEFVSGKR